MQAAAISEQKCQKALMERNIAQTSVKALEEEVNKLRWIGEGGEIAKLRKENERLALEVSSALGRVQEYWEKFEAAAERARGAEKEVTRLQTIISTTDVLTLRKENERLNKENTDLNQEACALQNLLESYRQSFVKRQAEIDELNEQIRRLVKARDSFISDRDRLQVQATSLGEEVKALKNDLHLSGWWQGQFGAKLCEIRCIINREYGDPDSAAKAKE
jgi:chromosome segregation ATPase